MSYRHIYCQLQSTTRNTQTVHRRHYSRWLLVSVEDRQGFIRNGFITNLITSTTRDVFSVPGTGIRYRVDGKRTVYERYSYLSHARMSYIVLLDR